MIETHTDRKIILQISKDTLKNSAIYGTIILHKQNIKKTTGGRDGQSCCSDGTLGIISAAHINMLD